MKIQVRKCPFTGKIFEEKDVLKYAKHLKQIRKDNQDKHREERTRKSFKDWLTNERKNIHYVEDLAPWFLDNQRTFIDAYNSGIGSHFISDRAGRGDRFVNLEIKSLRFSVAASNTHRCPDNGVTNWGYRDDSRPKGYIGWEGDISGCYLPTGKRVRGYPSSDIVEIAGFKTGSGGGGNEYWSYGVTIFLDDFPGLQTQIEEYERDAIISKLKGNTHGY